MCRYWKVVWRGKIADPRLALVAGLTRSEVQRFRDPQRKTAAAAGNAVLQIANLVTVWHTHPSLPGAYDLALDLDLVAATDPSRRRFDELVETAVPGADRDIFLDELIATSSDEIAGTILCVVVGVGRSGLVLTTPT
jgi:hypothetical protein